MQKNLARLKKIELRDVWKHEAIDFTNWLAQEENLDLLGEEIGFEIKLIKTEANVGTFKVDILAEEENTGRKIIVENQLEDTNHDHLGKIITYASGYNAEIIIWVVRDVREEHQRAIEWLNEHTDEKTGFFLIKIELWQIEESSPAPKFEIMASPNEWAKAIKANPAGGELSDTKLQQLDFWTKFKNFAQTKGQKISLRRPFPQHGYVVGIGSSAAHVELNIHSKENLLGCVMTIKSNKNLFNFLQERKKEIEKEIGEQAEWVDAAVSSRIKIKKEVDDIFSQNETENYFAWFYEKTVLFQKVFGKYFNEFKESELSQDS